MLTLKNFTLASNESIKIKSLDTILYMNSDIDAAMIGILSFASGKTKVCQFTKWDDSYKCKLSLTNNDLKDLSTATFKIKAISDTGTQQSNSIVVSFDKEAILTTVNKATSTEIELIQNQMTLLQTQLNQIINKSAIVTELDIVNIEDIKKGMIPVAIGNSKKFMLQYPFSDIINDINGQKAVDGAVTIDAYMIKYKKDITIETALDNISNAIISINNSLKAITDNQKQITDRLNSLVLDFEQHKNTGIV